MSGLNNKIKLAELYNKCHINVTFVILNWKLTVMQQRSVGLEWIQMNTDVLSAQIKRSSARAL